MRSTARAECARAECARAECARAECARAPWARRTSGKGAASIATVAVAGGLMAVAHYGGFVNGHDPFPHSVVAHP